MIPTSVARDHRFRHSGAGPLDDARTPAELAIPHSPYVAAACLDIAAEPCTVPTHMFRMDLTHMSHMDRHLL